MYSVMEKSGESYQILYVTFGVLQSGKNPQTALDLNNLLLVCHKFLSFRISMFFFRRICFKFVF